MTYKILVVDDDEVSRKLLKEVLEKEGYEIQLAESGESAVKYLRMNSYPIVLSDIRMVELDGMGVLRESKKSNARSVVILMTGFGSLDGAIEAIQEGAFDYVSKPFKMGDLKAVISRAIKHWESSKANREQSPEQIHLGPRSLTGKSAGMVEVYKTLARASLSSSTVLVMGESGTGKELVARAIHDNSQRRNKKFIPINCGALTETLLESELFGHVKGSFTGAMTEKKGLFEEADGGTLFLDEIGDISPALQIKLLRVLQENEIKPVGANEIKKVDVRVIAATHRDLEGLARAGKFREDLYYRLKVIAVELPPLRERMDDLSDLVEHFLAIYSKKNKKSISHVSEEALALLRSYSWPGNIRELEHAIERAVAMTNTYVLFPEDFALEGFKLSSQSRGSQENFDSMTSLEEMEKAHITKVLIETHYNKSRASEILGIDRATLYRKAQRYGIDLRGK